MAEVGEIFGNSPIYLEKLKNINKDKEVSEHVKNIPMSEAVKVGKKILNYMENSPINMQKNF